MATSRDPDFEHEFSQKQKAISQNGQTGLSIQSENDHNQHQAKTFDELATFFASDEAVPADVVPTLQTIAKSLLHATAKHRALGQKLNQDEKRPARYKETNNRDGVYRILDVGCGTGVLFDFYIEAANELDAQLEIQGLDLSQKMVENAKKKAEAIENHAISVKVGDIAYYNAANEKFDLVVANACFGNFWNHTRSLQAMCDCLYRDGVLAITHPLGRSFVQKLHEEDSSTVPHLLPAKEEFHEMTRKLQLQMLEVVDTHYFMATAVKVGYQTLQEVLRFRGQVDQGYGRGGKKLGFPTANLPSRLFQNALSDVACGVYFGWASLEGTMHKAVVNVGFSPTFEGQENPEKIIEAHLIGDDIPDDFYGKVMRLQLIGFIRPEMKFPSFPDLIAQITTDVEEARELLDLDMFIRFQHDPFVSGASMWIGEEGGNEDASWEFESLASVQKKMDHWQAKKTSK